MPSQYTEDESARPIGAPPSVIHAMRPINLNVTAPQGRNPLWNISSEETGISTESIASRTAEFTTEVKVLWCSLNASSMRLAIALSRSSLEMAESLNFFFIGDCSISLFRSPLSALVLMMGLMQSGSNFTDRIVKICGKASGAKN